MGRMVDVVVKYDSVRMEQDAAALGWNRLTWAKKARVVRQSVTNFCDGTQTPPMAKKLAGALGRSPRFYLLASPSVSAVRPSARRPLTPKSLRAIPQSVSCVKATERTTKAAVTSRESKGAR